MSRAWFYGSATHVDTIVIVALAVLLTLWLLSRLVSSKH